MDSVGFEGTAPGFQPPRRPKAPLSAGFGGTAPGFGAGPSLVSTGDLLAGRYSLLDKLGEGGMGLVFKARDVELERVVAVKLVQPELIVHEGATTRFKREVAALQGLNHPGIVRVYDLGRDAERDLLFYTMELLEGRSLRGLLEEHRAGLPLELLRRVFGEVCEAVSYAHEAGLLHRDLKPDNVIDTPGGCKVIDFGLVKVADHSRMTVTGVALGTAVYVAPEQLRGEEADARADVYALGAMLYELSCGQPPQGRFRPLRDRREGLPSGLDDSVDAAMQERPEDRPDSVGELYAGFQDAWSAPLAVKTTSPSKDVSLEKRDATSRKGPLLAVLALLLLAVGGFGVWKIGDLTGGDPGVTSPARGQLIAASTATVEGLGWPGAIVEGGGGKAQCGDDGRFTLEYRFEGEGAQEIQLAQRLGERRGALPGVLVEVDATDPVLTLETAAPALTREAQLEVAGRVSDTTALTLTVGGQPQAVVEGRFQYLWELQEGDNALEIELRDAAGHALRERLSVTLDTTAPEVTVISPREGAWVETRAVRFVGSVTGAASVSVGGQPARLTSGDAELSVGGEVPLARGQTFEALLSLTDGDHEVAIEVVDSVGNRVQLTRRVRVDATAPALEVMTPSDGEHVYVGPEARLKGRVTEANLASLTLGGAEVRVAEGAFEVEVASLVGRGVRLVARDEAGHETAKLLRLVGGVELPELDALEGWSKTERVTLRGRVSQGGRGSPLIRRRRPRSWRGRTVASSCRCDFPRERRG